MRSKKYILNLVFIMVIAWMGYSDAWSQGYLHQSGKYVVDGNGDEVILQGIGLGGWMLQEPYMLNIQGINTQHGIKSKIQTLIGAQSTDTFYTAWLTNYMQKIDVDSLASFGFNSIRLPLHYNLFTLPIQDEPVEGQNTWLPKGFELVDSLLGWCAQNHVYLILDLHATPGGQGLDSAISDYDHRNPSLWESADNRNKTASLWKKLAERYADNEWIGGYDLINETNWNMNGNTLLKQLYVQITDSIRKVDTHHMIIIEGNWFANDFTGLTPPWDNNMAYSFHKYGTYNTQSVIQWMLDIRNNYNVPVWCGEAGENSNTWYTDAISLLEANKIGWSWWSWKKFTSISGTNSVSQTNDYNTLLNYWRSGGTKPSAASVKSTLMDMTVNLKLENCTINRSVIDAMFRQVTTIATKPYTNLIVPGMIHATDYDLGRNSYAYFDTDTANFQYSNGGTYTAWNSGWTGRNDGVDIETNHDVLNSNGFDIGWTVPGEWMKYTIEVDSTAGYDMIIRYAGTTAVTRMSFLLDNLDITSGVSIKTTGSWTTWDSLTVPGVVLTKGTHVLKVMTVSGGCNLSYYSFENPKSIKEIPFDALTASALKDSNRIELTLNKDIMAPLGDVKGDFTVNINGKAIAIDSIEISGTSEKIISLTTQSNIHYGDVVTIDYSGSTINGTDTTVLTKFTGLPVKNNSSVRYNIPGKIQAENCFYQQGLAFAATSDVGGGQYMNSMNAGDYADYLVYIKDSATLSITFRVSASITAGSLQLQLIDEKNIKYTLETFSMPVTGGTQKWQSSTSSITLPAGYYKLRMLVITGGFNLNWIQIDILSGLNGITLNSGKIGLYPIPCGDQLNIVFPQNMNTVSKVEVYDITGILVLTTNINNNPESNEYGLDVHKLEEGMYFIKILTRKGDFTSKIIIKR